MLFVKQRRATFVLMHVPDSYQLMLQSSLGTKWEQQPVKDAVAKVVANAALMLPPDETTQRQ
jgi:hypothetical protein